MPSEFISDTSKKLSCGLYPNNGHVDSISIRLNVLHDKPCTLANFKSSSASIHRSSNCTQTLSDNHASIIFIESLFCVAECD